MSAEPPAQQPHTSGRLISLDVFRGLTILGMLLVNNVALDTATPSHLKHAPWNGGVTFADMVFPWFLFIVGVAIPYAAASCKKKGISVWQYDLKALSRMLILIFLGCVIDSSLAKTPVFDLGVLQLIGIAFFVAAVLYPIGMRWRIALAAVLLFAYWSIIRFVPYAGHEAGIFAENANIIKHINETYLNPFHLAGLVSAVPTSALVLIGTVIGDILRNERYAPMRKVAYVIAGGVGMALLGLLWSIDLPFNKPTWTSSYILYAAGWGALVFGALYLIVDVKGWRAWAFPLVVFGMNAIAAYVVPILVKIHVLWEWQWATHSGQVSLQQAFLGLCVHDFGKVVGGWLYTVSYIMVWWLVMLLLYRKKIFLKV